MLSDLLYHQSQVKPCSSQAQVKSQGVQILIVKSTERQQTVSQERTQMAVTQWFDVE